MHLQQLMQKTHTHLLWATSESNAMIECEQEEIALLNIHCFVRRAQRITGAEETGIPASPRDLGAVSGYYGELIG